MANDAPIKFSVVLAAYNAANTVADAVASCIAQSYLPHEIIVVDDGSTDDTQKVLEQFKGKIIYKKLDANSGPSHARNVGMDMATGQYIAFQDADDVWHPQKLKTIAACLHQNPGIRFLFHPFTLEDIQNIAIPHHCEASPFPFGKLLWRNYIGTPCVVMANDKSLRFDESMKHMEDYDLWLRTGRKTILWHLPIPLTRISRPVLSAGGQSSNKWAMRRGELKAYAHLCARHPRYYLLLPFLAGFSILKHLVKASGR